VDAGVMTVKFDKGCQVMNGERAIEFSRSRKSKTIGEEGDFARSARQMKVVAAIKDDILKKNLLINGLSYMDALQGNLRVSMEPDELFALANYFNGEGKSTLTDVKFDPEIMTGNNFLQETDKGGDIGYAIIPQAGEDKYTEIHNWVKSDFNFALIRRENVRLQVLNGSGIAGKGNALADFLQDQGFRQAEADSGVLRDETTLYDYSNGAATANINQLKQFLPNLKVISSTPDKKPPDNVPDLLLYLYLGKDYKGVASTAGGGQGGGTPITSKP
jgi:hypothetical protein